MKLASNIQYEIKRSLSVVKNVLKHAEISTEIQNAKPYNSIPGPKPAPLIGNMWRFFPIIGTYAGLEQHEINIRQNEEFGDLVKLSGLKVRPDLVLCFNPKDIQMVYRNEGIAPKRNFLNSVSHYRLKMRNDIYQGYAGIFAADGEEWQKARSILNPILMQTRTIKNYTEPVNRVADDFIKRIRYLSEQNTNKEMPENFDFELNKWALESLGYMFLEKRIGLFDEDTKTKLEGEKYLQNVLSFFDLLYDVDVKPNPWKYISTPAWRKYIEVSENITKFLQKNINNAIDKIQLAANFHEYSILNRMIQHDRKYIFGTILDMMIAGIDTTSKTLGSLLYYLSTHIEAQDKLRAEVNTVLPTKDIQITNEILDKMPYLRGVIKEAMRLAPIALGVARQTVVDQVLSGYHIPKGTDVMLCTLAMCRKNEYFAEAHKFSPERWLRKEGARTTEVNPWVYQPFGHGPRSCVGKRLANLELEILLAKLVQNFKMEWKHNDMKFKMKMIYACADPLKIQMKPIN